MSTASSADNSFTNSSESTDQQSRASSQLSYPVLTPEERAEADARSVHVANVDYSCTQADLVALFSGCGPVVRVTIPLDKFLRTPKGFAYIEFGDAESRAKAIAMSGCMVKGRPVMVSEKRATLPGMARTDRRPRLEGLTQKDLDAIKNGLPHHGVMPNGLNGGHPQGGMILNGPVFPAGPFFNGMQPGQGAPMPYFPPHFPYPGMYLPGGYPPYM